MLLLTSTDFLTYFHLLVDVTHGNLVNASSYSYTLLSPSPSDLPLLISMVTVAYANILTLYHNFFHLELHQVPTKHSICHHIKKMELPFLARNERKEPLSKDLTSMVVVPAHRSEKGWIPTPGGNYSPLKMQTERDHYPFPNISDITTFLYSANAFLTIHLQKGYYRMPMNAEDITKTAVTTHFGAYIFNYS
ncbi:uncharacterized protein [Palaemon carinicauda]|uniref:uncharacterized protein n=1 Tax=Palaemon carinicauda TaxID=392227 RepID=UPI0035B66570